MREGRGFEKDVLTRRVLEGLTVWAARPSVLYIDFALPDPLERTSGSARSYV
jgi:hypothetical protein